MHFRHFRLLKAGGGRGGGGRAVVGTPSTLPLDPSLQWWKTLYCNILKDAPVFFTVCLYYNPFLSSASF